MLLLTAPEDLKGAVKDLGWVADRRSSTLQPCVAGTGELR